MRRFLPLVAALVLTSFLVASPTRSADDAADEAARVADLAVALDGARVVVDFELDDAIDTALRRRLASGLPTGFVFDFELLRDRKRWFDKILRDAQLQVVAMYNAATREYLINFKLDGNLIESRVVRDPKALERALTHFEDLPIFTLAPGDAGGERLLLRVRAELGTRTVLFFVPTTRTTEWVESRKFRFDPAALAAAR